MAKSHKLASRRFVLGSAFGVLVPACAPASPPAPTDLSHMQAAMCIGATMTPLSQIGCAATELRNSWQRVRSINIDSAHFQRHLGVVAFRGNVASADREVLDFPAALRARMTTNVRPGPISPGYTVRHAPWSLPLHAGRNRLRVYSNEYAVGLDFSVEGGSGSIAQLTADAAPGREFLPTAAEAVWSAFNAMNDWNGGELEITLPDNQTIASDAPAIENTLFHAHVIEVDPTTALMLSAFAEPRVSFAEPVVDVRIVTPVPAQLWSGSRLIGVTPGVFPMIHSAYITLSIVCAGYFEVSGLSYELADTPESPRVIPLYATRPA